MRELIALRVVRKGTPTLCRVDETGFDGLSEAEGCRANWNSDPAALGTAGRPHIGLIGGCHGSP